MRITSVYPAGAGPDIVARIVAEKLSKSWGKTVLVETGGHRSIANVPAGVIRIVDIKCPGSGEAGKNDWTNLALLAPRDEVKFVIADRADYDYAKDIVTRDDRKSERPSLPLRLAFSAALRSIAVRKREAP